jgi:hypothetical protein
LDSLLSDTLRFAPEDPVANYYLQTAQVPLQKP